MKKKINISDKELDRDIINLHLPEIDWSKKATGYPKEWDSELNNALNEKTESDSDNEKD